MLSARRVPKACQSCRLQLLSLFEHGFTNPPATNASRIRYTNHQARYLQHTTIRRFSTSRIRTEKAQNDVTSTNESNAAETESIVRQARQTFGETLPKDYLSAEEYMLYERLYGPPLRETTAADLEYLPEGEGEVDVPIRNVLLKENADSEYEEVEFDPELGYSVVEDATEQQIETSGEVEGEELTGFEVDEDATEQQIDAPEEVEGEELTGFEMDETPSELVVDDSSEQLIQFQGKNQREIDAIKWLQKDMDIALAEPIEEEEEEIDEEFEENEEFEEDEEDYEDEPDAYLSSDEVRTHPHTMTGRSRTSPSTLSLPREQLLEPISELLARTNWKHLTEASEKAFGGKGLPFSASTPNSKKHLAQKHVGLDARQHKMSEVEADAYLAAVMPGTYSVVMSTLVEVRKRLGSEWIRDLIFRKDGEGPRVLDAGAGGAGVIAWREIVQAEWDVLKEDGIVEGDEAPYGKTTVLTGANTLRHRVSRFIENTTFLPRLPDYIHAANSEELLHGSLASGRKSYDVIIAPHTLFHLKEDFRRKNMVQNLWSLLDPNGGVLILIEKGLPRGFEAIAGARSLLLDNHISSPGDSTITNELDSKYFEPTRDKEDGMIIAPCTNHKGCPMYPTPGLNFGRKDYCHFSQRYLRPPFLQKVLGASVRNHEDIKYSYIAVRRGVDARKAANPLVQGDDATEQSFEGYEDVDLPIDGESEPSDLKFNPLSLPRLILPPLKRRGHVTLDLCTPSGKLERWTVPKSFGKAAHRDARKARWGDLWALGAKTRVPRSPRLGRLHEEGKGKGKLKGIRDGRMGKGGKKLKVNKFNIIMGKDGMEGIEQDPSQTRYARPGKRTKGGRIYKEPKPITPEDLG